MTTRTRAILAVVAASVLFGTTGTAQELGPDGTTPLGVGTLLEARRLLLLAFGAHKAEILARALRGPVGQHVPASFLREHQGLLVVCDGEAAARLAAESPSDEGRAST